MAITLGNFSTLNGRTVLTGISGSGLDTEGLISGLTTARELPKVQLEDRVELNGNKLTAYSDLRSLLSDLKDASNFLRSPAGVQNEADNVFQYRDVTLTSNTAISGDTYLAVTAEPGASAQNYKVTDITSLAVSTKQKTGTFSIANADTSVTTTSGTVGFFKAGTMTVNGANITLADGDTLNQVVSKFNEVKSTTGIEASVIQAGTSSFVISFTATADGTAAAFDLESGSTVTSDADGVLSMLGQTNLLTNGTFDSDIVPWTDASSGTGSAAHNGSGGMSLVGAGVGNEGVARQSFTTEIGKSYTVTMDLSSVSSVDINLGTSAGATDLATQNVTADGTVQVTFTATSTTSYLDISNGGTGTVTVDNVSAVDNSVAAVTTTQTATDATFTIDGVAVTRSKNTITDVVDGVTFTLKQTTPALTEVDVDITESSALPSSGAINFINAFNNLRIFIAQQSATAEDGTFVDEAYLAGETLLRTISSTISTELSSSVTAAGTYTSLSQVGITFTDLPESDDNPFTRNILTLDEEKFNTALAADFDSVAALFGFSFTTTNANIAVFDSANTVTASSLDLTITPGSNIFQATVDSVTYDLTATSLGASGYSLEGQAGTPLEGLSLIYASTSSGTATVTLSQGIADRIFNILDGTLDEQEGQLELEVDAIESSNTRLQTEIERIEDQVERYRESLITKFSALETLLSNVNTLLDSIDAQQQAVFSG